MNTVSEKFNEIASGPIRPLDWQVGISWSKQRDPDTSWFTLDQSHLNGNDILADNDNNPIQMWGTYEYAMLRDRITEISVSRSVEFPYNVQSAICDVSLNNYDGYFSIDDDNSPISPNILPARPMRTYLGFRSGGLTPVFVGTTQNIPTYTGRNDSTAQLTAMDFLSTIGDLSLRQMIMMRNARTDQVIAAILKQFGLSEGMFKLEKGINVIPFVFFDSDKNAGNALRELVQAENGAMWIDEQGIIRFAPRTSTIGVKSVMIYNPDSIISVTPSYNSGIINRVYVESDVREVQDFQEVFSVDNSNGYQSSAADDSYRLSSNGTTNIWINFDDPIWTANTAPVLNGQDTNSNFTAVDLSGNKISSKITVTGTLFAKSLKLSFTNTNGFPVSINYLQIWGEPAKVKGESPTIKYTAEDEESIEKFGLHELSITDNNCFGNQQNIDAFATDVLNRYASYSPSLELEIKGNPALQLQDVITLSGTNYDGDWMIKSISHILAPDRLTTRLTVVRHKVVEAFILDRSILNGPDVLS